ncbi:MAG: type II toxin-antitoxin system HicB family antitoxin [Acidobacteriaceae bacterium]
MSKYVVVYERSTDGYGAYVPDLPGLGVVGKTLDDTKKLIREGIETHIQVMRDHGEAVPEPTSTAEVVEIPFSA